MRKALVLCDGARPSRAVDDEWQQLQLRSDGRDGLNIRVPSLADRMQGQVPPEAVDLLRIAAFVHWADEMVTRPADTDVHGEKWPRHFRLVTPVRRPELWSRPDVMSALVEALRYGTDDHWEFEFEQAEEYGQRHMFAADPVVAGNPTCVLLFSGGMDSLCAAVQEHISGRRPLLISHAPSQKHWGRQQDLAAALSKGFNKEWEFPQWPVEINKVGVAERERTQRSRGFLYSAIGAAVAAGFGLEDVVVADNGWVSVGLPVSGQALGAKMSRTTHPRFQYLFNRLLSIVVPGVRARNPLLFQTRSEALRILEERGLQPLLAKTHSCAADGRLPSAESHCGTCSQCIDRRIAVSACRLQAWDVKYRVNPFLDDLEPSALMLAESQVRLMRHLMSLDEDRLVEMFGEVVDCATHEESGTPENIRRIACMLIRQAHTMSTVLSEEAAPVLNDLMAGEYSANCMVRLALVGKPSAKPGRWTASHSAPVQLSDGELAEEEKFAFRSRVEFFFSGSEAGRASSRVGVGGHVLTLANADFIFLLRLAVQIKGGGDGYCVKGDGKVGGGLVDEGVVPEDVSNAILRLRRVLQPALGEVDPKELIEVRGGRVRLSVHRSFVRLDRDGLCRHSSEVVRSLMLRVPLLDAS